MTLSRKAFRVDGMRLICGVCLLLLGSFTRSLNADTLQPSFRVSGSILANRTTPLNHEDVSASSLVEVSSSDALGPVSGTYFAQAQPGLLRIYAASTGVSNASGSAAAFAYAQDYLTVSGALEGALLQATFSVDGTGNDNYDGIRPFSRTAFLAQDSVFLGGEGCNPVPNTRTPGSVSGTCSVSVALSTVNGSVAPVPLTMILHGETENQSGDVSVIDFSHTAQIFSLDVYNQTGQLLPGTQITSASGFAYPSATSTVPEPATWMLLGISGIVIFPRKKIGRDEKSCLGFNIDA